MILTLLIFCLFLSSILKVNFPITITNEIVDKLIKHAEEYEKNSNQILDFTKDIKNTDQNFKIKLIESLWTIIYSDKDSDE